MELSRLGNFLGSDWAAWLQSFFDSDHWKEIEKFLQRNKRINNIITPAEEDIFRAFKECPFYTVHTVIIGGRPYPMQEKNKQFAADGIAYSARKSSYCPSSLQNILYALDEVYSLDSSDMISNIKSDKYDLKPWANQGILMINHSLTAMSTGAYLYNMDEHFQIWRPFILFLIKQLCIFKADLNVCFVGKKAQEYNDSFVNSGFNYININESSNEKEQIAEWKRFFEWLDSNNHRQNIKMKWHL